MFKSMSVFIYMKKTLAVLDKFLDGFYVSNKVNFQNHVTDKLIKWFVFDGFKNSQHMFNRASCFKPDKIPLLVF